MCVPVCRLPSTRYYTGEPSILPVDIQHALCPCLWRYTHQRNLPHDYGCLPASSNSTLPRLALTKPTHPWRRLPRCTVSGYWHASRGEAMFVRVFRTFSWVRMIRWGTKYFEVEKRQLWYRFWNGSSHVGCLMRGWECVWAVSSLFGPQRVPVNS